MKHFVPDHCFQFVQDAKTYQFTGADDIPPDVHIELYLYTVQRRADDVLVSDVINCSVNNRNLNIPGKTGINTANF